MWEPGSYHIPAGPRLAKTVRFIMEHEASRTSVNYSVVLIGKKKDVYIYVYINFTWYICRERAIP